jgi:hypothetical protein
MRSLGQATITLILCVALLLVMSGFVLMVIGGQPTRRCTIIGDHETVDNSCIPYCPPRPSECG